MRVFKSVMVSAVALVGGITIANSNHAEAKTYTTVPTSLRGHWYSVDNSYYAYDRMTNSKYHFRTYYPGNGWETIYGNKFPSYGRGHSQLSVNRNSKGYYLIGKYATDDYAYYKHVTHKGHSAVRVLVPQLDYGGGYIVSYYYRSKSIAKHPSGKAVNKSIPKIKPYHGYRVATNSLVSDNTFYDTEEYDILSDYLPTQYSKVIFQYKSTVVPTKHTWVWFHGSKQHLLTDYKYKNGNWGKVQEYNANTDKHKYY